MTKYKGQSLYKFQPIDKYLIENLQKHQLYFNDPKTFNDPFDTNIYLNLGNTRGQHESNYNKILKFVRNGIGDTFKEQSLSCLPSALPKDFNTNIRYRTNATTMCCFSESYENTLMWSHYADHHKGLVLEFKFSKCFVDFIHKVSYEKGFPIYNFDLLSESQFNALIYHMLVSKMIEWKYEKEWRILEDDEPKPRHFNKKELVSIIFGLETTDANIKEIIKTIRDADYNNVLIRRARVNEKNICIDYDVYGVIRNKSIKWIK
jgi:hypothetical protein